MKKALIIGGANGIGLSIALELLSSPDSQIIYIVDKVNLEKQYLHPKIKAYQFDLNSKDYSFFEQFIDIDTLIITAGFGHLSLFKDIEEQYIIDSFNVNSIAVIRLIKYFYNKIENKNDFYCGVMGSISGFMSSPFFSIYGATKAALKIFIESVNVELEKSGTTNRILNISPGRINGTSFYKGKTNLEQITPLAKDIIKNLENKNDLYIPLYDEIYQNVLERYHKDFRQEGLHSYDYKLKNKKKND